MGRELQGGVWLLCQQLVKFGDLVVYKTLGLMLIRNGYGPCKFLKKLYCLDGR